MFDPGGDEPDTRPLAGHSIAVYEPDTRLSLVWPVPAEPDEEERQLRNGLPEWAETDTRTWKSARPGWAVVLLGGAPIWQERVWYLDWGSGIGGYVPDFREVFGRDDAQGVPTIERWETTQWAVGLARLINGFDTPAEWGNVDPTLDIVPSPSAVHPVDARRSSY